MEQLYIPKSEPANVVIMMSGSGSNAEKIIKFSLNDKEPSFNVVGIFTDNENSRAFEISDYFLEQNKVEIPAYHMSLKGFYDVRGAKLGDMGVRQEYDKMTEEFMRDKKADMVILAGYDWKVTPSIFNNFLTFNVHPGALWFKDEKGNPKYTGLGWEASAKAMIDRQYVVYTSVHIVAEKLDAGPVLSHSQPYDIPWENLSLDDIGLIVDGKIDFNTLRKQVKTLVMQGLTSKEIGDKIPIYKIAKDCQENLKEIGDWRIFPQTIDDIARGNFSREGNNIFYKGELQGPSGVQYK